MAAITAPSSSTHTAPSETPRRVVVEHRRRRVAYAGDVMPIALVHDFRDGRDIGSSRSSDASFVHDQPLTAFLDEQLRASLEPVVSKISAPSGILEDHDSLACKGRFSL
jgi:hypothetical protein